MALNVVICECDSQNNFEKDIVLVIGFSLGPWTIFNSHWGHVFLLSGEESDADENEQVNGPAAAAENDILEEMYGDQCAYDDLTYLNFCLSCGDTFSKRANCLRHLKYDHAPLAGRKCELCKQVLRTAENLARHMLKVHFNPCPFCPRVFTTRQQLRMHLLSDECIMVEVDEEGGGRYV
jgi:hypothetical protein